MVQSWRRSVHTSSDTWPAGGIFRGNGMGHRRLVVLGMAIALLGVVSMSTPHSASAQQASACVTGGAVADAANTGLISDCEALLKARDALAGSRSLNWSENTPITQWDGITLRGIPERVAWLNVRDRGLNGTLSPELGRLSNLTYLNLRNNGLTGPIPIELGDLSNLRYLGLNNNELTGTIPDLSVMTHLEQLYFSNNDLEGGVPDWMGTLTKVRELWLWGNRLDGAIPDLSGMTGLVRIKLQNNQFTSGIPTWFGEMTNLRYLYLHYNPLGGTIPSELGGMRGLRYLWLHNGQLTGRIPAELGQLSNLWDLNLHSNQLDGAIPAELGEIDSLQRLRLHRNMLTGEIPAELGDLGSLRFMWLHGNMLSGSIPPELRNLEKLERLWLSENELTGTIPTELGELSEYSLVQWRFAGNRLTGCVPRELHFVADTDFDLLDLPWCDGDVASSPDLAVEVAPESVDDLQTEELFTLELTVRNHGDGASSPATLRYYNRSGETTISVQIGTDDIGSLGASSSREYVLELTAPSSNGTYFYYVCIDPVQGESVTQNNCSNEVRITVGQTHAIELVVDFVSVSPSSLEPGERFTLFATVRNQGSGSSNSTTLRYYRSSNSSISTSDTEVGTDYVGSLQAGQSSDESISLNAPSSAGTYYYGACADPVPGESDTQNNCSKAVTITVGQTRTIEIVVDFVSVSPSSLEPGERFTLNAAVRNQGSGSSDSTTLRYYRSINSSISTSDTEVGTDYVGSLQAGQSSDESISLNAPSSAGTYYYGACADPVPGESDTQNNCSKAVTITVGQTRTIEIVVDSVSISDSGLEPGERFTLNATVRNQGSGSSDSTTLRYYRSTNSSISTSDTEVGTDHVGSLRAGGFSQESISLTVPSNAGSYYYGACVDSVPGESDTRNNCSNAVKMTVEEPRQPNLYAFASSVGDGGLIFTGDPSVTFTALVGNDGYGTSAQTTLRYYLSSDSIFTPRDDTQVGQINVRPLGAGRESAYSVTGTAPANVGMYYFYVCVDSVPGESNTGDNCQDDAISVRAQKPAFLSADSRCWREFSLLPLGHNYYYEGTIHAVTSLSNVTLTYYVTALPSPLVFEVQDIGSMVAGSTFAFSRSWFRGLNITYGACGVNVVGEY